MANKRIFKKNVSKLTSALINDMMTASVVFDGSDKEAVDNAVINLIKGSEAAVVKANVKFDKGVKAFESQALYSKAKAKFFHDVFKKLKKEYSECVEKSISTFNAAFPEELKKNLKKETAD